MTDTNPLRPDGDDSSGKKPVDGTVKAARIALLGVLITAVLSLAGVITAAIINANSQATKAVNERPPAASGAPGTSQPAVPPRSEEPSRSPASRPVSPGVDGSAVLPVVQGERINFETLEHGRDLVNWHALVGTGAAGSPILEVNPARPIAFGMIGNNPANIANCTDGLRQTRRSEFSLPEREKYPACVGLENGVQIGLRYRPSSEAASSGFIEVGRLLI